MLWFVAYVVIGIAVAMKAARYLLAEDGDDPEDFLICSLMGLIAGVVWPLALIVAGMALLLRSEVPIK
jgi:hypothetical protein